MTNMSGPQILTGRRILFVFCSLELGGAERQGMHLARHLKSLGCDVHVWGHMGPSDGLVVEQCNDAGIPWAIHRFRWPSRKISLVRDSWRLMWALRKERPDVIISYTKWANVSCGLTWRWSPAKICIWSQRDAHWLNGDTVERFAYRRCSAVICNAEHMVNYLRRTLTETSAPISVVHNGLDLAPCLKTRASWRAELAISENTPVAAMVANFRAEKDHRTLLEAWRKILTSIPEGQIKPRLLLAGLHLDTYSAVHQLASDLGLHESVAFLGQVRDVSGLLAASDIGILTSTSEGLSNSIIEYMASGLPVVATDLPGNREALGDDLHQQFSQPGDADSLAARLQAFLYDPIMRQKIGALNRHRAAAEFSLNAMCGRTTGIINDLLYSASKTSKRAL